MIVMVFCGFMMVVLLFKAISMIVVNPFVYLGQRPLVAKTNDFFIINITIHVATLREISHYERTYLVSLKIN